MDRQGRDRLDAARQGADRDGMAGEDEARIDAEGHDATGEGRAGEGRARDGVFVATMREARQETESNDDIALLCLDVADEWRNGRMPIGAAHGLCGGKDLFIAMSRVIRGSEEQQLLSAYADAVCAAFDTDGVQTRHGWFTTQEVNHEGGIIVPHADGVTSVIWPVSWEWRERPTFSSPGVRGRFIYRGQDSTDGGRTP